MDRRKFFQSAAAIPAAGALAKAAEARKQMKITGIETDLLRMPPGQVTYDAIRKFGVEGGGVVLRVATDAGITGWAYSSFGAISGGPRVVQAILEHEVKPIVVGMDPAFPKGIRAELWRVLEYQGMQSVTQFALSALDIALWDILGKAAGMPVYKMLGAYRDRVPAYSMCGWYRDSDPGHSQYKRTVTTALEQGYRAVKIKVGKFSLEDDIERIKVARETAGKDIRVLVDANQALTAVEALRRGRVYQEMGCYWLEEPMPPHDLEGYADLKRALDIRIATGENLYNRHAFFELLLRRGADVVQPDNRRAGGPTEWMEIAAIADGFGAQLASHGGGGTNMNMLCAIPNAIYLEAGGPQKMVNGEVLAPEEPGMSSELRRDHIAKYKVG